MSNKPKYPVYFSPLNQFKKTKQFSGLIYDKSETSPISAFKRNDQFSQTLGHKSYSDFTFFAKSYRDSDTSEELYLFCDDDQLQTPIIDIFYSKPPAVPRKVIESAVFQMTMDTYDRMLITPFSEKENEALAKLGGQVWTIRSMGKPSKEETSPLCY